MITDSGVQGYQRLSLARSQIAVLQVLLNIQRSHHIKLAIDITI
jgi:hypothetical protein